MNVFSLYLFQLKEAFSLSELRYLYKNERGRFVKHIALGAVVLLSLSTLLPIYCLLLFGLNTAGRELGRPELALALPYLAAMLMTLVFGLFHVISTLLSAKDAEFLASMPLPQSRVFLSKFLLVYTYEFFISLVMLIPADVVYGVMNGGGAVFWLKGVVMMFLVPAVPLSIATLAALLILNIPFFRRHREGIMIIISFLLLTGYLIGQQMLSATISSQIGEGGAIEMLKSAALTQLVAAFPPAAWAALAVVKSGFESLWNLLLTAVSGAACVALSALIASKAYYKGMFRASEAGKRGKRLNVSRSVKSGSPLAACVRREILTMLRSPVYALNCLTGAIVFPIMIIAMSLSGNEAVSALRGLTLGADGAYVVAALSGIMCFMATINPGASTSVSREGSVVWVSKMIPVSYKTQAAAKLLTYEAIALIGIAVLAVVSAFIFGMAWLSVQAFLISAVSSVGFTALNMLPDYFRPKTRWSSEAEAIKRNMSSFFGMLAALALLVVLAVSGIICFIFCGAAVALAVTLGLSAAASVLSAVALTRVAEKRMPGVS